MADKEEIVFDGGGNGNPFVGGNFSGGSDGRFAGPNDFKTPEIRYATVPHTRTPGSGGGINGDIQPFNMDGYNRDFDIVERYFAIYFKPSYGAPSGQPGMNIINNSTMDSPFIHPFTYLTVKAQNPSNFAQFPGDTFLTTGNSFMLTAQDQFLYVEGTIFFYNTPQGFLTPSGVPAVPKGVTFEHYGCVYPRKVKDGEPEDNKNKYWASEFIGTAIADKRIYTAVGQSGTTSFPSDDGNITNYDPISSFASMDHPINYNYDTNEFECKLTLPTVINTQNSGQTPPAVLVKGKYLLM